MSRVYPITQSIFYEEGDTRLQTLKQAEKLILSEMPVIPLYHADYVYMINPRLPLPYLFGIEIECYCHYLLKIKKYNRKINTLFQEEVFLN